MVMTGADDGLVKFWSAITGCLIATGRGHTAEVNDLQVSPCGRRVASASVDSRIGEGGLRWGGVG